MSTSKTTELESLQLAEQLLKEIKQHKTTNHPKEIKYNPPNTYLIKLCVNLKSISIDL